MEIQARAPGKIILSGEHAVVHGSTAVAAAIDLYTKVSVFPSVADSVDGLLELRLEDLGLVFSWSIERLKEILPVFDSSPTSFSSETLQSVVMLVEEWNIPEAKIGLAAGVSAFLCLHTAIRGYKN